MYKNFKNIEKIVFGRGSFAQLDEIISPIRVRNEGFFVFVVDAHFEGKPLAEQIPLHNNDVLRFIDVKPKEPTTQQVDRLRDEVLAEKGMPGGIVGIGGGSIMDIAKAAALMFTNAGSSQLYQGLNLVKNEGIYHLGVPTISGTGAECSMTAVLSGPEKKLGLKCEWTVFNQVILDPDLVVGVPSDQWFYTGMDTFIHCIESKSGIHYNAFSQAYGDQAIALCKQVFLGDGAGQTPENDEKLMMASLFGGLSLTYSEVGACHALSYGLSVVLGIKHGYANCLAFNHLELFYGEAVAEFRTMVERFDVTLPQNLSKNWSEKQITDMAAVALNLPFMWEHALGKEWDKKFGLEDIKRLYRAM